MPKLTPSAARRSRKRRLQRDIQAVRELSGGEPSILFPAMRAKPRTSIASKNNPWCLIEVDVEEQKERYSSLVSNSEDPRQPASISTSQWSLIEINVEGLKDHYSSREYAAEDPRKNISILIELFGDFQ